jgi:uncharacterized protein YkwD
VQAAPEPVDTAPGMSPSLTLRHAWIAVALAAVCVLPAGPAGAARPPLPCVPGVTCAKPKPKPKPKPACAHADALPTPAALGRMRRATLCLLNAERRRAGLARLHSNRALRHVAARYARLMVQRTFFDHVSPAGSTFVQRILRSGYLHHARGYHIGENLAWGGGTLATPREIVRAWMASPPHRANILSGLYRHIGVGISLGVPVVGGGPGATYVNEFGRRR